jgi:hypothetical protein
MLESEVSLRLKPVLWGKLERRKRHEAALARAEFILSKGRRYSDVLADTPELEPWTCPAFVESVFDFTLPALRTEAG